MSKVQQLPTHFTYFKPKQIACLQNLTAEGRNSNHPPKLHLMAKQPLNIVYLQYSPVTHVSLPLRWPDDEDELLYSRSSMPCLQVSVQ